MKDYSKRMKQKMNIYDIAMEAGVSPATVSRVVNGNKNVKDETRKKVLKIIEEKKYVPNSLARNLSVGDSQNIAFLAPDIENPFFSKIFHGLLDTANQYGYNVFMYGTNDDLLTEHRILDEIKKEMIKGIVIIPISDKDKGTAERLEKIQKNQIPVVLLDRDICQSDFDGVFSTDYEGACEGVQCLIRAGHKKIAIITGELDTRPGRERFRGYKKALKDADIKQRTEYIVNGMFKEAESYDACKRLMEIDDRPTAIFTSSNLTTLGCLKYLKKNNLKIGRDISLVCFDEIRELQYSDICLTVVDRPIYEMGCAALELLEYNFLMENKMKNERIVKKTNLLKTKLIVRGSEKYVV